MSMQISYLLHRRGKEKGRNGLKWFPRSGWVSNFACQHERENNVSILRSAGNRLGDSLGGESLDYEYDPDIMAAAIDIYGDEYETENGHERRKEESQKDINRVHRAAPNLDHEQAENAVNEAPKGREEKISPEEEARRLREQYMRMRLAYTKNNYDKLQKEELERQKRNKASATHPEAEQLAAERRRRVEAPSGKKRRFPKLGDGDFKSKLQRLQQLRRNWRARQNAIKERQREHQSSSQDGNETWDREEEIRRRDELLRRREEERRAEEERRRRREEEERRRRDEEVRKREEEIRREEERRLEERQRKQQQQVSYGHSRAEAPHENNRHIVVASHGTLKPPDSREAAQAASEDRRPETNPEKPTEEPASKQNGNLHWRDMFANLTHSYLRKSAGAHPIR